MRSPLATFIIIICLFLSQRAVTQDLPSEANYFALGATFKFPKENFGAAYYGVSPEDNLQAFALFPTLKLAKGVHFMPGYIFSEVELPNGSKYNENQFLPSLIFTMPISKKWVFTSRFMYFHRLILETRDKHIYRNRVGISYFPKIFDKQSRLFVHDAIFVDIDAGNLIKNRLIFGGNIALTNWIEPEVWYVLEHFNGAETRHLFYLILNIPLQKHGIFSKHKKKEQKHDRQKDHNFEGF